MVEKLSEEIKRNNEIVFGKETPEQKEERLKLRNLEQFNNLKKVFIKNKQEGIAELANYLLKKYNFKTIMINDTRTAKELYVYQKGIYEPKGELIIEQEAEIVLEELIKYQHIFELKEKIKRLTYTDIDKKDFGNEDKDLICLKNGVLNLKTMKLETHLPDKVFLNKLPIKFDNKADCPAIKKFFSDVLYDNDIAIIQEFFGFCLYRNYFIKKALLIVGEKNGGKTQMMNLLTTFLGKENISGENLQNLSSNRFSVISLFNKMANIYDDLDFVDVSKNGIFKMATGNSMLTGERKFCDSFQFINYAKIIYTANKIPNPKDLDDDAYYSRWIILRFDETFDEDNLKSDPFILDKLTTPTELSGLLNYALEGLNRLLEKQKFSFDKSPDEVKKIMERSGNSLAGFVFDELKQADDETITKDELYLAYSKYTAKRNLNRLSKRKVGNDLPKLANYIIDGWLKQSDNTKNNVRVWRNVAFKQPKPIKIEDDQTT